MTTLSDLLTPKSVDTLFEESLLTAREQGLPTSSWQPGSVPRTLLRADATALADLHLTQVAIARGAFLDEASGGWLTLLAASRFQVTRTGAVFCRGYVRVTVATGAGPYTIPAAGLLVSDGLRRWRSVNAAPVVITSAAPVSVLVEAEGSGTAYNVAVGAITTVVSPALAGVSVTNPAYAGGTWITRAGASEESDASVRERCRARWSTLGRGATDAAYEYHARTGHAAEAQVTRAKVVWGPGDGTLTVFLAGPAGAVSSSVELVVGDWIRAQKPGTDHPTVRSAEAVVVPVVATVTVTAATDSPLNRARATDALAAYFASLAIGEAVDQGRLYQCLYAAAGVLDADLTLPAADVPVNTGQVATPSVTITWVVV